MKQDKKALQLVSVESDKQQESLFKSMSLSELLAALELIVEFERESLDHKEFAESTREKKYLH